MMNDKKNENVLRYLITLWLILFSSVVKSNQWQMYSLQINKDDKVCIHMNKVFDQFFSINDLDKIHAYNIIKTFPNAKEILGKDYIKPGMSKSLFDMNYTFYPKSREFDKVNWNLSRYKVEFDQPSVYSKYRPFLYASVDIDNDGHNEFVIKTGFRKSIKSIENIHVYEDVLSVSGNYILYKNIAEGTENNRPRIIYGNSILRIFVFNKTTYLANFNIKESTYPDEIRIEKYLGGGKMRLEKRTQQKTDLVCRYILSENLTSDK
ncbi:MAG: hypothetical protein PVG75_13315 [Thioalkalispiraceae bacterium]